MERKGRKILLLLHQKDTFVLSKIEEPTQTLSICEGEGESGAKLYEGTDNKKINSIVFSLNFIQKVMREHRIEEIHLSRFIKDIQTLDQFEPSLYYRMLLHFKYIPELKNEIHACEHTLFYRNDLFYLEYNDSYNILFLYVKGFIYVKVKVVIHVQKGLQFIPLFIPFDKKGHTNYIKEMVMFRKIFQSIHQDKKLIKKIIKTKEYKTFRLKTLFG